MKITAQVANSIASHRVTVATNGVEKSLTFAPKLNGRGSAVNGGELLLASLATCLCNDIFREAAKLDIDVQDVEVRFEAYFPSEGAAASDLRYDVQISGSGDAEDLRKLVRHTDSVAEIHNTVRSAIPFRLGRIEVLRNGPEPL